MVVLLMACYIMKPDWDQRLRTATLVVLAGVWVCSLFTTYLLIDCTMLTSLSKSRAGLLSRVCILCPNPNVAHLFASVFALVNDEICLFMSINQSTS